MPEPGSSLAGRAWDDAARVVSSSLLYVESRSAVAGAYRAGRIPDRLHLRTRAALERFWRAVEYAPVDDDIIRTAGDLAEQHALRGYDAVHLASALALADEELILVSSDRELLDAASTSGIATLPAL